MKHLYNKKMFKKSFSLVEAAIYLMLVGVLTTAVIGGAALVEKAKINNIIEDLMNYDNAYTRFAIQYHKVPGELDLATCNDNIDIFKRCVLLDKSGYSIGDTISRRSLSLDMTACSNSTFAMMQLEGSGLLSNIVDVKMDTGNIYGPFNKCSEIGQEVKQMGKMRYNGNIRVFPLRYLGSSSFTWYPYNNGSDDLLTYRILDKIKSGSFYFFIYATDKNTSPSVPFNTKAKSAAFSSNILKKVDVKIDDGLPRRGRIQGIKIHKSSCYDKGWNTQESASIKAQYINSTKPSNGCNALFFLSDFSSYIFY